GQEAGKPVASEAALIRRITHVESRVMNDAAFVLLVEIRSRPHRGGAGERIGEVGTEAAEQIADFAHGQVAKTVIRHGAGSTRDALGGGQTARPKVDGDPASTGGPE